MAPKPDRVHVVLGLLLALGIGFRAIDPGPGSAAAPPPALAAHRERIARAPERAGGAGRAVRKPTGVARSREDSAKAPRVEHTPAGAVAPGATRATPAPGAAPIVNLDRASPGEIEALPGIGPALARRIVEDRERNGPFGSLAGLERVKGVGARLAARLAPLVTFESTGRPNNVIATPGPGTSSSRRHSRRQRPALVPPGT